ncbi:Structural maintenance of chromosomes 1A [Pyrenophora seminiperda CCB06]|uniref:Structural maintenance of chromosomes 1A n=1 Tax=Pyrenophora seminiperda CCB06 TaxID=1302712 RepID=A0A3M7MAT2_9PLEO|nr:Structural maintenance of chromosomes 1A [Pyrenophora seminiperda CCB06]
MNEPPTKRRRTNSPDDLASSPLRKPPRRPSYASPTKSHLARNYPNLVPSRRSTLSASPRRMRPVPGQNGLRREKENGASEIALQTGEDDESELPGTPSQESFEGQHQQRGGAIFSSSPSKRPPRAKRPVRQSPPRKKAPAVQLDDITRTVEDGPTQAETQPVAQQRQPPDPEIKKREQKARLQRKVEELEAEVSRCVEEIAKEQRRAPGETLPPKERDDLTQVHKPTVLQHVLTRTDTESDKPAPVSTLLCSFLPFAALSVPQPRPKQPAKAIPSHRPLELADPLPYLEMFTSLKFSTQISLPRDKVLPASSRVHQKHTIDITGPQKLLTAQIAITIDGLTHEIIDMHILRLSPWAEGELGSFIRARAQDKDIGNAAWAMDSYWELAHKRAQYWQKCQTKFAHLLAGRNNEDAENHVTQAKANTAKPIMSRKDLTRNLGRDTLVLQDKHVLFKLNWRISFDWTGEAESDVTVEAAFPKVWSETDTGASLKKVPETFTSLLRTKGAFEATRIMVALLFAR